MDIHKFEEAYLNAGGKSSELEKENGEYTSSKAQMGWEMWKTAKAKTVPEGFVLVPMECSDDMAEIILTTARVCGGIAGDIYDAIFKQAMIEVQEKGSCHLEH